MVDVQIRDVTWVLGICCVVDVVDQFLLLGDGFLKIRHLCSSRWLTKGKTSFISMIDVVTNGSNVPEPKSPLLLGNGNL